MNSFYYLRMLRFKDWVPGFFWVPILGAVLISSSLKLIFIIAIISFCTLAYAFVINNYFDVGIDKKHKRKIKTNKNPLAQGLVTQRGTLIIIGFLLFSPLALAAQVNFNGFIFVILSVIASTLYSIKHIRFKEKSGIDLITHGFMFGLFPVLAGAILAGGSINFPLLFIGFLFFLVNCSALLSHQIIDYEEDLGNTRNTAIKIGRKMSFISLILLQFVFLLCFMIMLRHFTVEWWVYYLFIFLLFWIPLDCIRRARSTFNIQPVIEIPQE